MKRILDAIEPAVRWAFLRARRLYWVARAELRGVWREPW